MSSEVETLVKFITFNIEECYAIKQISIDLFLMF